MINHLCDVDHLSSSLEKSDFNLTRDSSSSIQVFSNYRAHILNHCLCSHMVVLMALTLG